MIHSAPPVQVPVTHVHHAGVTLPGTIPETPVNVTITGIVIPNGQICASLTVLQDGLQTMLVTIASAVLEPLTMYTSTAFQLDGPLVTLQHTIADVEPTLEVMETSYVGTTSAYQANTTSESGYALRALDTSLTTTTKHDHTTMIVIIPISQMITIPLKLNVVNSHTSLMNVTKMESLLKDSTDGSSSLLVMIATIIMNVVLVLTEWNWLNVMNLIMPLYSYNVLLVTSSSLDPIVESTTSLKDSSTDSSTAPLPQSHIQLLVAHGPPVMVHAQVCVTGISTWETKTVSNATTPVSMDAVMVTHVQTMPATQTVPHVAAQELINVLHVTATPL